MSLSHTPAGYALGANEGEALWFNGAFLLVKATSEQTGGGIAAVEFQAPKGFASPLHIHRNDDEFFLVLDGEVRFQLGENVVQGSSGSLICGPRGVGHSFHVDSPEARLLLLFGPAGAERSFREGGKPARSRSLPPAGEQFLDRQALMEIAKRYGQDFVGPPLPPKN